MKALILLAIISFNISKGAEPAAQVALDMMKEDLQMVTDQAPVPASASKATIRIVQYNKDRANLKALGVPAAIADSLKFVKEAFWVGILEISRLAGVSPWVWWNDAKPAKRPSLDIPEGYSTFQHPSVEYRGLFLNDEDWAFRPWAAQTYSPQGDELTISADAYRQIFKLLLRLRGNTMWPGMHPGTTAFFQVPGAREAADSCGILIGTSHCEPLLRNNVGEWNTSERGAFNYISNKQAVQNYWIERLKEVKGTEQLFTIGMRGIHDGSMEGLGGASLDRKTEALQEVINDQQELLKTYINKDVTKIPQMFMPYKEVLEIYENGLDLPDHVTTIWCDDNYGYMTRLSSPEQQKRRRILRDNRVSRLRRRINGRENALCPEGKAAAAHHLLPRSLEDRHHNARRLRQEPAGIPRHTYAHRQIQQALRRQVEQGNEHDAQRPGRLLSAQTPRDTVRCRNLQVGGIRR